MGDIESFSKKISRIEEAIKNDLYGIDNINYDKILDRFGLEHEIILSTELDDDKNALDDLFKDGKEISKHTGIYLFKSESEHMTQKNWDSYKNHMKEKRPENKVPKWNKDHKEDFFYIGKSNDLKKRIKEHTDTASPSTYALKLKEFKQCFSDFEYKIHIFYPKDLDRKNSSISNYRAINELVESVLHDSLKPMIGNK